MISGGLFFLASASDFDSSFTWLCYIYPNTEKIKQYAVLNELNSLVSTSELVESHTIFFREMSSNLN